MDRSNLLSFLSATISHQEFFIKMKEVMSLLSKNKTNDNEDDCYSIPNLYWIRSIILMIKIRHYQHLFVYVHMGDNIYYSMFYNE